MTLTFTDEERLKEIIKEELREQLRFVPTKEVFLDKMDKLMTEIKASREDVAAIVGQKETIEDHEDRIYLIENKLGLAGSV